MPSTQVVCWLCGCAVGYCCCCSQDQERELLQRGYETLQVLEAERIADLLKAGARTVALSVMS